MAPGIYTLHSPSSARYTQAIVMVFEIRQDIILGFTESGMGRS